MTKKTKDNKTVLKEDTEETDSKEDVSLDEKENKISEEIETLKAELAEENDSKLRALADVENMRRRMEKEKQENARYGASNLARGLFSILETIEPNKGDSFDHNIHQAMLEVPTNEFEPGCVCEVLQCGYKIYDRLLRPAMVGVSKKES